MKKKISLILVLALVLVFAVSFALTACGKNNNNDPENNPNPSTPKTAAEAQKANASTELDTEAYFAASRKIYDAALSEYEAALAEAQKETGNKRYALEAIAEAKLLESAVYVPTGARGGNYAIGRVAPHTVCDVLYGNDSNRFHNAVVTSTPITAEDRAALKALYGEKKGTGTYEAACKAYLESKGYTIKDDYSITFSSDPQTWDNFNTQRAADSEAIVNTFDGLLEYDIEGTLKPALATGYTVSEDGLTYTFTIRQGVVWVNSQGQKVADLTADDFVAGFQHMLDQKAEIVSLVSGIIKNAAEYTEGKVTDFAQVGVKATDDYTLVYTLEKPTAYFVTMLGYNPFAPMCRSFFESKGGKFGSEFADAFASETYTYGKTADDIAYCGPYTVTAFTSENSIVFSANPLYWNKDNINIKTLTWKFNDGSDATKAYKDMVAGTIDGCGLNAEALELAKTEKTIDGTNVNFEKYGYTTAIDGTSFGIFMNLNRGGYYNINDDTKVVSSLTVEQAELANTALQNVHFRRAIAFALDRASYNAQSVGEDLKLVSLINSYVPGTFVSLDAETTVKINGKDTTFSAGTAYGAIMQAQLDADGVKIKAWDPTADSGAGSSAGYDGWYNEENAKAEMELALKDLAACNISAENPVILDLPTYQGSKVYTQRSQALKQSIEKAFGGKVIVNCTACDDAKQWYWAGYYCDYGYQDNYNMYDCSGWGPDYGDPDTYLNTLVSESGDMIHCLGIY